jgi:hypothetical protein
LKHRILPARTVVEQVESALARKPRAGGSPLDAVCDALCDARRYSSVSIRVRVQEKMVGLAHSGADSVLAKFMLLVPLRLAGRILGTLEASRERDFGEQERVLLKQAALLISRFLATRGKYIVRKAREANATAPPGSEARGYQPQSEKLTAGRRAAGDSFRS